MDEKFDVIVVGSGFGGGTVALRLAQAGKRVCVLERGRRWRGKNLPAEGAAAAATPFPELGDPHFFWGRQLWRPTRQRLGLYEIRQLTNLQGMLGAGVGGGSLVWANVVIEAPPSVFENGWPSGIDSASLQRYYRLADPYLQPSLIPGVPGVRDLTGGRVVRRAELLKQAAAGAGADWKPVSVAVNFGDEHKALPNGHGKARQLGCNYCGLCTAGCPQNAKNTVDITYLSAAEALGAQVRPLHLVTSVAPLPEGGYRVGFKRFDLDGRLIEHGHIDGQQVVLSAGTFGTTELLLRMRRKGLLANLSPALGSRFSINGNVLSGALLPGSSGSAAMEAVAGPAISSVADFGQVAVEDLANPTWAAGIVGTSSLRSLVAFALALAGHKSTPASLRKQARDLLVYVGVGQDLAAGRLKLNFLGGLSLHWPGGINSDPAVRALHEAMEKLARAQGRKYVPNVFSIFGRPVTYHPLGGCPMSDNAETGVVDAWGRVYGHPGLYVADGSMVPTALGRNPAYTIAALAERVAERMVASSS